MNKTHDRLRTFIERHLHSVHKIFFDEINESKNIKKKIIIIFIQLFFAPVLPLKRRHHAGIFRFQY